jgi:hypothetical protein
MMPSTISAIRILRRTMWLTAFRFPAVIILLSMRYFPKPALQNLSILLMKSKDRGLFVNYCLIRITGDIPQKAEERSVE